MLQKKQEQSFRRAPPRSRLRLLRQMTNEFDRMFGGPFFSPSFPSPSFPGFALPEAVASSPKVDVFEKDELDHHQGRFARTEEGRREGGK